MEGANGAVMRVVASLLRQSRDRGPQEKGEARSDAVCKAEDKRKWKEGIKMSV